MKAPAIGLFLREVHFDQYNKFWGKGLFSCFLFSLGSKSLSFVLGEGREPVLLSPDLSAKIDEFAQAHIWPGERRSIRLVELNLFLL